MTPALRGDIQAALRRGEVVVVLCGHGLPRGAAAEAARGLSQALMADWSDPDMLRISRTATEGLAAIALCLHHPVGVDLEARVAAGAPEEINLDRWCRLEAATKALGVGLAGSLAHAAGPETVPTWDRCQPARALGAVWCQNLLQLPAALAGAVALNAAVKPQHHPRIVDPSSAATAIGPFKDR